MGRLDTGASSEVLLDTVYEAGIDGEKWIDVMSMLGEHFGSRVAWTIRGQRTANAPGSDALSVNFSAEHVESFFAHYGALSPWNAPLARSPVGRVVTDEELCPREELVRTEFYNDWLRPQEDLAAGCGVVLFREGERMLLITANLRRRDEDALLPGLRQFVGEVAPHIRRAFDLSLRLDNARFADRDYVDQLDRIPHAVFLLNRNACPTFCNRAAGRMLSEGAVFVTARANRALLCRDHEATKLIHEGLHAVDGGAPGVPVGDFPVRRPDRPPLAASLFPLRFESGPADVFRDFLPSNRPVAVLTVTDPYAAHPSHGDAAARVFALTQAEARLAAALAERLSLAEFAERNRIGVSTARTQLSSLFAKTGTTRQGELVALLGRFPCIRF